MKQKKISYKDREQNIFASKCKYLKIGDTVYSAIDNKKGIIKGLHTKEEILTDNFIVEWEDGSTSEDHYPHQLLLEKKVYKPKTNAPDISPTKKCDKCGLSVKYYGIEMEPAKELEIYKCDRCGWVENVSRTKKIDINTLSEIKPSRRKTKKTN